MESSSEILMRGYLEFRWITVKTTSLKENTERTVYCSDCCFSLKIIMEAVKESSSKSCIRSMRKNCLKTGGYEGLGSESHCVCLGVVQQKGVRVAGSLHPAVQCYLQLWHAGPLHGVQGFHCLF